MLHHHITSGDARGKVLTTLVDSSIFDRTHTAHFPAVPATFTILLRNGLEVINVAKAWRSKRTVLTLHGQRRDHAVPFAGLFKLRRLHRNQRSFSRPVVMQDNNEVLVGLFDILTRTVLHIFFVIFSRPLRFFGIDSPGE